MSFLESILVNVVNIVFILVLLWFIWYLLIYLPIVIVAAIIHFSIEIYYEIKYKDLSLFIDKKDPKENIRPY